MSKLSFLLPLLLSAICANAQAQWTHEQHYEYDAVGRPTVTTNAANETQRYGWDALGRLTGVTNPLQQTITFTYQGSDYPIQVQAPNGAVTTYQINGVGETTREDSPDRGITNYVYNIDSSLSQYVDARGVQTKIRYGDFLYYGFPAMQTIGSGAEQISINYFWQSLYGRLDQVSQKRGGEYTGFLYFSYDDADRLTRRVESHTPNGLGQMGFSLTTDWQYTPGGKLSVLKYPSQSTLAYSYDGSGNIIGLNWNGRTIVHSVSYIPFGPIKAFTLGNDQVHNRPYDKAGRIEGYTLAGNPFTLERDNSGRIVRIRSGSVSQPEQHYQYDAAGRIQAYESGDARYEFTYDSNGNLTERRQYTVGNPVPQQIIYGYGNNNNRMVIKDGNVITSDETGNQTSNGRFIYDAAGRLERIFLDDGQSYTYRYNSFGERNFKGYYSDTDISNPYGTYFVYDQDGHLLAEYHRYTNNTFADYIEYAWLGDLPVAMRRYSSGVEEIFYIESDHLGTPRTITDQAGRVRWRWYSDPYGEALPDENPEGLGVFTFNLRFPGQYYDVETGLHYNYFRDYDPSTGRYIQSDPIGLNGGINTFAYAEGAPTMYADPYGLQIEVVLPAPPIDPRFPTTLVRATRVAGPVGAVTGAAVAGYEIGGLIYPIIEIPLANVIDWCVEENIDCTKVYEECMEECVSVYVDKDSRGRHVPGYPSIRLCTRECMNARGCFDY